jgi:hypothetical protein
MMGIQCDDCYQYYYGARCEHCGLGDSNLALKKIGFDADVLDIIQAPKKRDDILLTFNEYVAFSPNKVSYEEYNRYKCLHNLLSLGIISDLQLQTSFVIQDEIVFPAGKWYKHGTRRGFKQQSITYSPDFVYAFEGVEIIEEYKGLRRTIKGNLKPRMTTTARNKIKRFVALKPDKIISGDWCFVIVSRDKEKREYVTFDPNGNIIDFPI